MPANSWSRCTAMTSSRAMNRATRPGHGAGAGAVDGDQARELVRDLDAGEEFLVADRVADHHGQVQGEPGDVGERVRRVHGQRRQDREDLLREHGAELVLGLRVEFLPVHEVDVLVGQRRADLLGVDPGVALLQPVGLLADLLQDLHGAQPGGGGDGEARGDPALQPGHPDHEELVQVGGEDGQEADPLQQVQVGVLGQFQDPGVEREPAQFPVQEPVRADVAFRFQVRRELRNVDPVLRGA